MSAEVELTPPKLMAGVFGSRVTLNWTHADLGELGTHELTVLNTGETFRTQYNAETLHCRDGEWRFQVTVSDGRGRSATSNEVTVEVRTSNPEIPVVRIRNEGIVVTLDWETVPHAVSYEIVCNSSWIGNVAGPPDDLAGVHFVHHAWHDGVYNYQVRSRDVLGHWSPFSRPVTHIVDTAPPDAPEVEAIVTGLQVRVQWQQPVSKPPVRYHIRCNGEDVGTTTNRWFDFMAQEAGPYSFRVRTVDSEGRESEWSEVTEFSSVYVGRKGRLK